MGERRTADPGPDVVLLHTPEQLEAAAELLGGVWGARTESERKEVMTSTLLRTLSHSGNYVAGAYRGGDLVGCTVGLFGARSASAPPDHLHSDIAGVVPAVSNRGVGFAMKRHQRAWTLEHGIGTITWTFDPLVARNAYFNFCKLGASVVSYEPNFYGRLDDGTNTNQNTDRLVVEWDLRAEWVEQMMISESGASRRHAHVPPQAELIAVPEDISMLRGTDPQRAQQQRITVRQRFQSLIAQGYRVVGMSRAKAYVLLPARVTATYDA